MNIQEYVTNIIQDFFVSGFIGGLIIGLSAWIFSIGLNFCYKLLFDKD